ncbi:MAG: hypothetical protein KH328_01405 [Staphylococcus sp.]|jgi:phage terminase large subunit-like protein|nr:hypothetical protein [Staphylococcus sp.]
MHIIGEKNESYLLEYYHLCKSGEKLIGQELMTALDMYASELNFNEYRLYLKPAHKRINFIEKHIKHFEAPFAGKPFLLTIEQKAIAETLFGYQYFDPEYNKWVRRFQEILLLMARKNGKTPFLAALALADFFCGTMGQKFLCASNDHEQASLVFDCINNFREESNILERCTRKNNQGIFFGNRKQKKKKGKYTKQNKGSIKKMSAKSGAKEGRNLKFAIVDEVHEMKDDKTVMPVRTSLTTQEEPVYFEITTEGVVTDGYLDKRLAEARKVLKGELKRTRWLIWLYTQDSEQEVWQDESTWVKSNPLLGVCKKWSTLRGLVDEARTSRTKRAFILAKEFNIKYSRPNAWLEEKTITQNDGVFDLEDFRNSWCIAGVDLSETNDLSAATLLFLKPDDNTKYLHTMYFVPESKAIDPIFTESPTNTEKKNYLEWEAEGWCRVVKGNIIDDNIVAEYLWEIFEEYSIRPYRVGYDAWKAREFKNRVAKNFGDQVPVQVGMNTFTLNVPTCNLEDDLKDCLVNYQSNPMCTWNFKNTAIRNDSKGLAMPVKLQGFIGNKIDGTMSKVIAYEVLKEFKTQFKQKVG